MSHSGAVGNASLPWLRLSYPEHEEHRLKHFNREFFESADDFFG